MDLELELELEVGVGVDLREDGLPGNQIPTTIRSDHIPISVLPYEPRMPDHTTHRNQQLLSTGLLL